MSTTQQDKWIDIARTGTFKATNGRAATFTPALFDRMIQGFDEKTRRIPLVFGHPATNAPAYGWVEALRRNGDTMQAKFKQVHDDVKRLVSNGNFKNVSISISPDLSFLRHVGLLGAAQPAIPGLREVSFADSPHCLTFELSPEEIHEEIELLKDEVTQLRAMLEERQVQQEEQDKESKMVRLKETVAQGKVSPGEFSLIEPFAMALLESNSMLNFADGSEPVHVLDAFIDMLHSRQVSPLFIDFSELAHPAPAHMAHRQRAEDGMLIDPAYII